MTCSILVEGQAGVGRKPSTSTARPGARRLLSSPQTFHAAVMSSFPDLVPTDAPAPDGRVLRAPVRRPGSWAAAPRTRRDGPLRADAFCGMRRCSPQPRG